MLLAEVDGDPIAAIGIFGGHAIIDPARSTRMLRIRMHLLRLQIRLLVTVYA
jgi:hypothetical protein